MTTGKELEDKMVLQNNKVAKENLTLSEQSCKALLIALFNKVIQPKLTCTSDVGGKGYTSVEEIRLDFSKVREQYEVQAKGPAKLRKLVPFTETKLCESMNMLQGQMKEAYERKMCGLEELMNSVKEDLERERGAVGGHKTEMKETLKKLAVLQAKDVKLERDMKEKTKAIEDLTLESNATRNLMKDFQIKVPFPRLNIPPPNSVIFRSEEKMYYWRVIGQICIAVLKFDIEAISVISLNLVEHVARRSS